MLIRDYEKVHGHKDIADYVMVYQIHHDETQEWQEKREQKRQDFFDSLKREGLELEEDKVNSGCLSCVC